MFTSYILDKDALALLWKLFGGDISMIPAGISTDMSVADLPQTTKRLEELGLLHISGGRADVERTISFLVKSMIMASEVEFESEDVIFHCDKLIIVAVSDMYSAEKCKLIPMKDKAMLEQYLAEKTDVSDDEENDK